MYSCGKGRAKDIDWIWERWTVPKLLWYCDMKAFEIASMKKQMKKDNAR